MHYATLHQVRAYLNAGATQTQDDNRLIDFINQSVKAIDDRQRRRYDVRLETRRFDYPEKDLGIIGLYNTDRYQSLNYLWMDDDLLEVTALTNGDGTVFQGSAFNLKPANIYPKHSIFLLTSANVSFNTPASGEKANAISVVGYWGYHDRYAEAWEDSLDMVQNNPLTAGATSLTVGDADGVTQDGQTQRFQAGQMLKIENEFVLLSAVNNTTNVCTIKRGYNGTTAAEHVQGTKIYIYRPPANIQAACIRLTAWRYRQKDVDVFDKSAILGTGIKITPSAMPPDVVELLGERRPDNFV